MTRERRLKHEAIESCNFRGHVMTKFYWLGEPGGVTKHQTEFRAVCIVCLKSVDVKLRPQPNECEISGDALALGCSD